MIDNKNVRLGPSEFQIDLKSVAIEYNTILFVIYVMTWFWFYFYNNLKLFNMNVKYVITYFVIRNLLKVVCAMRTVPYQKHV